MKRKLFIGSSTEGFNVAKQVKEILENNCGDWLEIVDWRDPIVFKNNKSFLDNLVLQSKMFDYGLLVATKDDISLIRRMIKILPRDNVVFEMGLFLGSLGLTRTFFFADKKCKLPSDYNGITIPTFKSNTITEADLRQVIDQLESTKNTFAFRPIPSASLALGYFGNFILPTSKSKLLDEITLQVLIPETLEDIDSTIQIYKTTYPSELVSVYDDNSRPFVHRLIDDNSKYWDIPTTLKTLKELINFILPPSEIGTTQEKMEWIQHELRNFKGSLDVLINEQPSCRGKVIVDWIK